MQPYTTQHHSIEPYTTQHHSIQPYTTQHHSIEPYTIQQHYMQPYTTQQHSIQPYTTQHHSIEPYTTQQHYIQPYTTQQHYIQPLPGIHYYVHLHMGRLVNIVRLFRIWLIIRTSKIKYVHDQNTNHKFTTKFDFSFSKEVYFMKECLRLNLFSNLRELCVPRSNEPTNGLVTPWNLISVLTVCTNGTGHLSAKHSYNHHC